MKNIKKRIRELLAVSLLSVGLAFSSAHAQTTLNGDIVVEQRREEIEKLKIVLESKASAEEKRSAVATYQVSREQWRADMEKEAPQLSPQEKAAARAQVLEMSASMPDEQRSMLRKRLEFVQRLETLEAEGGNLPAEEKSRLFRQLAEEHGKAIEFQVSMWKTEAQGEESPFAQALKAEKQKLVDVLQNGNPEQKREAVERFRAALKQIRESQRQQMERE